MIQPPYQPNDILYVRETWCDLPVNSDGSFCGHDHYYYKADGDLRPIGWDGKWHPSIHMPKAATRIWLKVTDVRVERLKDIMNSPHGKDNQIAREGCKYGSDFIATWDSTIKKSDLARYGWNANPWVFVIEFERCKKPESI